MKSLSPDELAEIRAMLSGLDLSPDKQDDFIRIIDNFVISCVEQAHGTSQIQLSLTKQANYSFDGVDVHAKTRERRKIEQAARHNKGVIKNPNLKGPPEP